MDTSNVATKKDIQELKNKDTKIEKDIKSIKQNLLKIEKKVQKVEEGQTKLEAKIDAVEEKLSASLNKIINTLDWIVGAIDDLRTDNTVGTHHTRELKITVDDHEKRLKKLETN